MSRNINVNPDHYKVAGRERQGERGSDQPERVVDRARPDHARAELLLRRSTLELSDFLEPMGVEFDTLREARRNRHSGGRRPIRDLRQRDTDIYGAVDAELEVVRD